MKKASLLLFLCFTYICQAQEQTENKFQITDKGRVIFTDTIQSSLSKTEIASQITDSFIQQIVSNKKIIINAQDTVQGLFSYQVLDYLELEKKALAIYAVICKYNLILQYKDNQCIALIRNMYYIDLENFRSKNYSPEKDNIPGEIVLVEKQYKTLFMKDASERITQKTQERVDEVFLSLKKALE